MKTKQKKVISLLVAMLMVITTIFSNGFTSITNVKAETTGKKEIVVHFYMPSDWKTTDAPNIYAYQYDGAANTKATELSGKWPGTAMQSEGNGWYKYTVSDVDYAKIIFTAGENCKYRTPEEYEKDEQGNVLLDKNGKPVSKEGYKVTEESWFKDGKWTTTMPPVVSPTTTVKPTVTPTAIVATTPAVTATPIVGPQVITNIANGTVFYEDISGDALMVGLTLKDAVSGTYSVDDGPVKTFTNSVNVKVGQGKIPDGSDITLKVTATDGVKTNTQIFTYKKEVSFASRSTYKIIKTFSDEIADNISIKEEIVTQEMTVHFRMPSDWETTEAPYIYAYTSQIDEKTGKDVAVEYTGKWPGIQMVSEGNGWYHYDVSGTDTAKIIFTAGVTKTDKYDEKSDNYIYDIKYRTPAEYEQNPETGKWESVEGYEVSEESWFDGTIKKWIKNPNPTATPVTTPTVTPVVTATAAPTVLPTPTSTSTSKLKTMFGAEKSAPQYNTTKQKLIAHTIGGTGTLTYTFAVDYKIIYRGTANSIDWDASTLSAGDHTIQVIVTDEAGNSDVQMKTYTIEERLIATGTPGVTETPVVTATSAATEVPVITGTPATTGNPIITENPVLTTTPSASNIPVVTETPATSETPIVSSAPIATETPGTTDVPVITEEPQVPGNDISATLKVAAVKFSKNITLGETVKIKATVKGGVKGYSYTYKVKNSKNKTTTLAKNVSGSAINWTPASVGTYTVKVTVKDAKGTTASKSVTYKVGKKVVTVKSFKTNKKSGQKVKTRIKITAKATTTKGKVYYQFAVKLENGTTKIIKKYSKKSYVIWKPTKKGEYTIYLKVKNGKGIVVTKKNKFVVK